MVALSEMVRHPTRSLRSAADTMMPSRRTSSTPMRVGGIIMLVLAVVGFIWVFPELRRYLRIERM